MGMMTTFALLAASPLFAALVPLSPVGGQEVALVPDAQKRVMTLPTLADRLRLFRDDKAGGKILKNDMSWRNSLPLVLEVLATADEPGPWKVMIGKRPDLSDARTTYVITGKLDPSTGRVIEGGVTGNVARLEVPRANLEVGTRYYWRVGCRGKCSWDCHPKHGCTNCTVYAETPISTFVTEDVAPRWIALEGRVGNVRDLGGRTTSDGRRVRQGLVYRGQGLNDNSATGEIPGRNRLTVEDVRYLTGELGIRTDLDLRGPWETADMAVSPLGEGVRLVVRSSPCYKGIFEAAGRKTMAENFRLFCDRANYPIYFHCIGGADRTGSLAYVLNAVLGVSRRELETDWEATFYPRIPDVEPDPGFWRRESHFNDGFAAYGAADADWNERVVLYLKDCGITDAEIAAVRDILLESRP